MNIPLWLEICKDFYDRIHSPFIEDDPLAQVQMMDEETGLYFEYNMGDLWRTIMKP